jgi:myosin-15
LVPNSRFRLNAPSNSWTWAEQVALVKYSQSPIEQSLLPLDENNNRLAIECYISIMKYMGDYGSGGSEVEAVYTLLRVRSS